jgi:hypothetical protein
MEGHAEMGEAVLHGKKLPANGNVDTQFAENALPETLLKRQPVLPRSTREFPETPEQASFGPPDNEDPAVFPDDPRCHIPVRQGRSFRHGWDVVLKTPDAGEAGTGERAPSAGRFPGQADRGAEIHHGLVEWTGPVFRHQRLYRLFDFFLNGRFPEGFAKGHQSAHDATDISVNGGYRLFEGDAQDGAGRVGTDAGEGKEPLRRRGEFSAVIRHKMPGRFVEVSCAGIVTHVLPGLEDVVP